MNFASHTKPSQVNRSRGPQSLIKSRVTSRRPAPFDLSLRSIVSAATRGTTALLRSLPSGAWAFLAFVVMCWIAVILFKRAVDTPTVFVSYGTHQCVRVENANGTEGHCDQLPKRFRSVWVY